MIRYQQIGPMIPNDLGEWMQHSEHERLMQAVNEKVSEIVVAKDRAETAAEVLGQRVQNVESRWIETFEKRCAREHEMIDEAIHDFIARLLGILRAVGLPTDDCDGDEAPETILSGWIIANTMDASHRISDLEHRIDLLRATHETDKATLLRLAKAARNVVEMLPHGPDRYELEVSLGGGGAEPVAKTVCDNPKSQNEKLSD